MTIILASVFGAGRWRYVSAIATKKSRAYRVWLADKRGVSWGKGAAVIFSL